MFAHCNRIDSLEGIVCSLYGIIQEQSSCFCWCNSQKVCFHSFNLRRLFEQPLTAHELPPPFFSSPDPKGHVRYCHHLASVVRPLTFYILIYSSETTGPNGTKLGRKHLYKVLYKVSSFRPIPPTNMAAKGNSCFWLANVKKIFSSETAWPNGAKLGRKHLCKILYKTSSFNSIRPTNMAAVTKNRTYGKIARFW